VERKEFLKKTIVSLASLSMCSDLVPNVAIASDALNKNNHKGNNANNLLSAYYLRANMYTCVPSHIREDMKWLASVGTDNVCLAVLEQDFFAAKDNITLVTEEANKWGISVYAVPSRWAGLNAGAPKVPSLFSVNNPQTWKLKKDGKPYTSNVSGVMSSVYYPETIQFFKDSIDRLFSTSGWNFKGIIWDEPKGLMDNDYSAEAVKQTGSNPGKYANLYAMRDFYSDLNRYIKNIYPDKVTNLFVYGWYDNPVISEMAKVEALDYFGADGNPWGYNDLGQKDKKVILGHGQKFIDAAKQNKKRSLFLIENFAFNKNETQMMRKRFPELLQMDINHLIYYYYGRSNKNPDNVMDVIRKYVGRFHS